MDCAAEENLVRLKLDELGAVRSLDFNLLARNVTVYHEGQPNEIEHALGQLGFSSKLLETEQTLCGHTGTRSAAPFTLGGLTD